MAKLTIQRKFEFSYGFRGFDILIDGEDTGAIGMNNQREFELSPGEHTVQAKVDWFSTPLHTFTLEEGQNYQLRVSSENWTFLFITLMFVFSVIGDFSLMFTDPGAFASSPLNIGLALIAISFFGFLIYMMTAKRKEYLKWREQNV
ncbi:MAG: hypothetical protein AAFR66_18850 [Bacteroidota bacterium]